MATINAIDLNLSGQTGTGTFVGATSPTLVTPTLGVATATSINFGGSTISNYITVTSWTPVVSFATPGDLSVAYPARSAVYMRIGSMVIITWTLQFTPTYTTASGVLQISGIPVAPNASGNYFGNCINATFAYPAGKTMLTPVILGTDTFITVYGSGTATTFAQLTTANVASGSTYTISGTITYFV